MAGSLDSHEKTQKLTEEIGIFKLTGCLNEMTILLRKSNISNSKEIY